ncbi:MAG TPA: NAD(P)-dependent oxidoreductase [Pyrinomonadaceae bacterium]|nr:NAD(P)-dependent oxidoreductase [Pyrinomonadaceae bacterium]
MKEKVILTGANGFIGRQAILPLTERNFEVHAVSNVEPPAELLFENVVWHKVNLLDAEETAKLCENINASHLLHFAWYVEHGKFWNAPENEIWLKSSVDLIESFKANGGERIVVSGTCAEYEWGEEAFLSENETPLKPQNFYGECKLKLFEKLAEKNLNFAWGRIFFLFGEYEHPNRLIASVINSLLKENSANCSHGRQIRDFMYVKDVADAFASLLDSDVKGAVNIASGRAVTIKEIVLQTAEMLGKTENIHFGAIEAAKNEPLSIVADTRILNEKVGWRERYGIASGLAQTINYWKNYENND